MPGGSIILILTRWHEDDLAGRLIEKMKDDGTNEWEIISLKAINDEGKALWPEWYDEKALAETRNDVGERDWNALYQQNPVPDEGTFFKRAWFEDNRYRLGEQPKTNKYQSTDFAVTTDGGDFTELGVIGLDKEHDLWVEDWWHGQESADIWVKEQLKQIKKHNVLCSFGEKGVIRRAVEPLFRTLSKKERIYPRLEWLTRTGDKVAMARALQGMAASGKVHIPRCAWGDGIIEQLVAFPAGKHDDAVDVLALFCMAMQQAHPAILNIEPTEGPKKTDMWGRYSDEEEDSWRV
jgi:predicted phage terminase large subunit-like protein